MYKYMKFIIPSIVIVLVIIFTVCYVTISKRTSRVSVAEDESLPQAESTLVLAHVLFRHGNRVPNNGAYSNNPINNDSYYPEGYGQLSEAGKSVAYRIGTTLHRRYGWFLGDIWNVKYIDARVTNIPRTKMSLQLMLAGLWPPKEFQIIDPSLNWQAIPFNVASDTKELDPDKICKNFETLKNEVENSPEIQQALTVYDGYLKYISDLTGDNVTTLQNIFDLCMDQSAQLAYGYPLEDWVVAELPIFCQMATDVYRLETNTTALKSIVGGYLLKKMLTDSASKINGTINPIQRKMFIYSAHERNLAYFLRTLDIFDGKVPEYGTHILVELHLVEGIYGFKIYHQDWTTSEPRLVAIPGCQSFCPFDQFTALVQPVIPEDDFCITS